MKKTLVIGTMIVLIVGGANIVFSKKNNETILNQNDFQNNKQEESINKIPEIDSNEQNDIENDIKEDNQDDLNQQIDTYQITAEFKGFADSNFIEIYSNGEYQVMRVNEEIKQKLEDVNVGEEITLIYSNVNDSNIIINVY